MHRRLVGCVILCIDSFLCSNLMWEAFCGLIDGAWAFFFHKDTRMTDEKKRGLVFGVIRCLLVGAVASAIIIPSTAWVLDRYSRWQVVKKSRELDARSINADNPPSPDSFFPVQVLPPLPQVKGFVVLSLDDPAMTM